MKLRIQGNSLRLRLNQKEVALVRKDSRVESSIEFAPGCPLFYFLEGSPDAEAVSATFDGRGIRVTVPLSRLTKWALSDQVGIDARSPGGVDVLIEKDFQCLHGSAEESRDAFPNPLSS